MEFSLIDYQDQLINGAFHAPSVFSPYFNINKVAYKKMEKEEDDEKFYKTRLLRALRENQRRVDKTNYRKIYPLQAKTLDYSYQSFPCYKFMLPEVITDDWLAMVDSHEFQRDHILHQPLTGYVVLKLLNEVKVKSKMIIDICVDEILNWTKTEFLKEFLVDLGMNRNDKLFDPIYPSTRIVWKELFREAAYIAAVFHDLGYPWQYVGLLTDNLQGFNHAGTGFYQNAQEIMDTFQSRLIFYPFNGYKKNPAAPPSNWLPICNKKLKKLVSDSVSKTHGFPGALGFLYLNDAIRKYPNKNETPLRIFIIEWVATAIMMHDMKKIYWGKEGTKTEPENPKIRSVFSKDPLSSIITLADVVQDFQRPIADFRPNNKCVCMEYLHSTEFTVVSINGDTLNIEYKVNSTDALAVKNKSLIEERKEYFDSQHGYLDLTGLGINKVTMSASK